MSAIDWILARLAEPSTWAGLAGLFAAAGLSEQLGASISATGTAAAGLIAVVVREKARR